jgi:hypothetical protein
MNAMREVIAGSGPDKRRYRDRIPSILKFMDNVLIFIGVRFTIEIVTQYVPLLIVR